MSKQIKQNILICKSTAFANIDFTKCFLSPFSDILIQPFVSNDEPYIIDFVLFSIACMSKKKSKLLNSILLVVKCVPTVLD